MTSKKSKEKSLKEKLRKINQKEYERLKSSCVVNTRTYLTKQSFGAASEVRRISVEEYLRDQ